MKKLAIDRWIPEKDRPSPKRPRTAAAEDDEAVAAEDGLIWELDEVDDIPIGELYVPPRMAAASTSNPGRRTTPDVVLRFKSAAKKVDKEQSRNESAQIHPTASEVQPTEAGGPSGPVSMSLVDPDVLDCPICFEPLSSPVYQCENGHIACASCCTTTLKNKCANCFLPIENIRCRAIENVVESVRVACQYRPYGCTDMFSYSKKLDHEKACIYVPCSCPCFRCDFVGTSNLLYDHFALKHKKTSKKFYFNFTISISMDSTKKRVILQERRDGVIFVLNRYIETRWSSFNVVCVAPSASEKIYLYELTACIGDDLIKVKTSVEMMSKWTTQPPKKMSLMVPTNLVSTLYPLELELIIRKKPAPANLLFTP